MGKDFEEKIKRLSQPFAERDIEWVVTFSAGSSYQDIIIGVAPYIKRESIMDRLDIIFGPTHWKNQMMPFAGGLYQGLVLVDPEDGAEYMKWDGAEIPSGGNDNIDAVKSVATSSFRRAAELYGVGRYLKRLPVLFARKQQPDDYSAEYNTYLKKANGKVRWNPPEIPGEFLPDYMTPEQWRYLRELQKHFQGDGRDHIQGLLDTWEGDPSSIEYGEATMNITKIEEKIQKSMGFVNAKEVHGQPRKKPTKRTVPPPSTGKGSQPPPPGAPPSNKGSDSGVSDKYKKNFKVMRKLCKEVLEDDPAGLICDTSQIIQMQKAADKAIKDKKPLPVEALKENLTLLTKWKKEIQETDDDLPF